MKKLMLLLTPILIAGMVVFGNAETYTDNGDGTVSVVYSQGELDAMTAQDNAIADALSQHIAQLQYQITKKQEELAVVQARIDAKRTAKESPRIPVAPEKEEAPQ